MPVGRVVMGLELLAVMCVLVEVCQGLRL